MREDIDNDSNHARYTYRVHAILLDVSCSRPRRKTRIIGYLTVVCLAVSLVSCTETSELRVAVRTDYVPAVEFQSFEVRVGRIVPDASVDTYLNPVGDTDRFIPEYRALSTTLSEEGIYRVEVRLLNADGAIIAERTALAAVRGDTGVTVVLTRNCADVECPTPDAPAATECLDGRCVPPECTPETPELCPPPDCSVDAECMPELECAVGLCLDGACVQDLDPGNCMEGEYCSDNLRMCLPREPPPCTPSAEICDGLDNDCDPTTPDGSGEPCPLGSICSMGSCREQSIRDVALGKNHTCAVLGTGKVYCWGDNRLGQLGNGRRADSPTPSLVDALSDQEVVRVVAGHSHSCALTSTGDLYCWGGNRFFATGVDPEDSLIRSPALVPLSTGISSPEALCAGEDFTCTDEAGEIRCWGRNDHGQLGDMTTTPPARSRLGYGDDRLETLHCGSSHACAEFDEAGLICWGLNTHGQVGNGETMLVSPPRRIALEGEGIDFRGGTALGGSFTCVLNHDTDAAHCVGANVYGQLGRGTVSETESAFAVVSDVRDFDSLAAGDRHACATNGAGDLFCWGGNDAAQVGIAEMVPQATPVRVPLTRVESVHLGGAHSCAVVFDETRRSRGLWCWGDNSSGQIGAGRAAGGPVPAEVLFP